MSTTMKFSDFGSDGFDTNTAKINNNDSFISDNITSNNINSSINGFSTIDLNSQTHDLSYNNQTNSSISSGYTSFDQPFGGTANTNAANNQNSVSNSTSMSPKRVTSSPTHQIAGNNSDLVNTGTKIAVKTANTIENIKQWSKSAFKCTKQIISEKLGKTSRTIDPELEAEIQNLRDTREKYKQILNLSRSMCNHFYNFIQTQKQMSELFNDLSQKTPELQEEFNKNSETQRLLFKNGQVLLSAFEFFTSNLSTLCNKTIEDTLITIRNYEAARLEYDAYRCDLEIMQNSSLSTLNKTTNSQQQINQTQRNIESKQNQLNETEKQFKLFKERYEKLRDDVNIKIKFLDENKLKVMQKQLLLFHNATSAYFSGNQEGLEATMKQFSIKLTQESSFLEKN